MNYLTDLNARRDSLTGIQRVWADFNMTLEIIDADRADGATVHMAIDDCKQIIAWLEEQSGEADTLEVKRIQLAELESMAR
jgi:hypothetical protein